jgi:hypothetical protein
MEAIMARKLDAFATPGVRSISGVGMIPPHNPDVHAKSL